MSPVVRVLLILAVVVVGAIVVACVASIAASRRPALASRQRKLAESAGPLSITDATAVYKQLSDQGVHPAETRISHINVINRYNCYRDAVWPMIAARRVHDATVHPDVIRLAYTDGTVIDMHVPPVETRNLAPDGDEGEPMDPVAAHHAEINRVLWPHDHAPDAPVNDQADTHFGPGYWRKVDKRSANGSRP
jgi:hypothetical protein